ncbi:MAG: ribosome small subunit-dependent GTPase A [Bacteroidaceae bacterium]|nr:ribosome small subunit-dependent GTPase A [Bacteroidaceae bacterium]
MKGVVVKNTGSWYEVLSDGGTIVPCKIKGNFRLRGIRSTNPIAVGDHVAYILNTEGTAFISEIEDRRNYIIRRASNLSKQSHILAANLDQVVLVITLKHPETSTTFIDRFLASAEAYRIPAILMFNKSDLLDDEDLKRVEELMHLYQAMGYTSLLTSVQQATGLSTLPQLLQGKVNLIAGHSGVGKSALLNFLIPGLNTRTAPISAAHDAGMHTTTFSQMFQLPFGGVAIDIPGVKGFGTFDFDKHEVSHFFREIFQTGLECRYSDCMHLGEPHCAVREAVEEGIIAKSRYASYLSMLGDQDESKYREAY